MPFPRRCWLAVASSCLVACAPSAQIDGAEPDPDTQGGAGGELSGGSGGDEGGASGSTTPQSGGQGGLGGGMAGAAGQPAGGGGAAGAGGVVMQPVPEGSPIIVALGDGGFTMTSCDLGRTWKGNPAFSGERGDHTGWTSFGGLAFGNGTFVGGLGWGAPGHVIASSNAVMWTEVPDAMFLRNNMAAGLNDSIGAVAFDGKQHYAFSRYMWTSTDGRTWQARENAWPSGVQQLRQLRGFAAAGILVASVETQSGGSHAVGNWVIVSSDGGKTWSEGKGFRPSCSDFIQHSGDIEMKGDVLVVAAKDVCRSTDLGKTWEAINGPTGGTIGDVFASPDAFYLVAGDRLWKSEDGKAWQPLGARLAAGVSRGVAVGGKLVVVNGAANRAFTSSDGLSWQAATIEGAGNQSVRDLVVGYGTPAASCPQP